MTPKDSLMSDQHSASTQFDVSKSGVMPRPVIEPDVRNEAPLKRPDPTKRETAKTGVIPIIREEGEDTSAQRDEDAVAG
jgi:hypothetical protein